MPAFTGPDELAPIKRAILDDPTVQARLGTIVEGNAFAGAVMQFAGDCGIPLSGAVLQGALRPDPLGLGRWAPAPVTLDRWAGPGWLPARPIPGTDEEPQFDWFYFGDKPPAEPFFEDSVRRAAALPINWLLRTRSSLDAVIAGHGAVGSLEPSGFIFHMSRSGSTLLARMLMAVDHHAVASEPEPLDAVLQWAQHSGAALPRKIAALRAMVAALGGRHSPPPRRYFLKLDAWHSLSLPLIRAAFPDVPWVFVYRDPVEVMVSQQSSPGVLAVPGMLPDSRTGIEGGADMVQQEYRAEILARICEAVVEHWQLGGGMVVNYRNLLASARQEIPRHFGFIPDAAESAAFAAATLVDAKQPAHRFVPDAAAKQAEATDEMRNLASFRIGPVLRQLEQLEAGPPAGPNSFETR